MLSGRSFCACASLNNNITPTRHIVHQRASLLAPSRKTGIEAALHRRKKSPMRAVRIAYAGGRITNQRKEDMNRTEGGWWDGDGIAIATWPTTREGALVSLANAAAGLFPIIARLSQSQISIRARAPLCPFNRRPAKMPMLPRRKTRRQARTASLSSLTSLKIHPARPCQVRVGSAVALLDRHLLDSSSADRAVGRNVYLTILSFAG